LSGSRQPVANPVGRSQVLKHIRDLRSPPVDPDPADERCPVQNHRIIGDEFPVLRRHPGAVCKPVPVSIHQVYTCGIGTTELPRGFDDRLKYTVKIRCGSSDDGKNLACRTELLAHLSQLISQPFGLGCYLRMNGRVLIGRLSLVPLDHSATPYAVYPSALPSHQCPLMAPGKQQANAAGHGRHEVRVMSCLRRTAFLPRRTHRCLASIRAGTR